MTPAEIAAESARLTLKTILILLSIVVICVVGYIVYQKGYSDGLRDMERCVSSLLLTCKTN